MDPFTMMVIMIGVQLLLRAFLPGPKPLEQIQITASAEGQPIPFLKVAMRVAGGLIWASEVRGEQVKTKAGKLWHYFQTCAYQFTGNPVGRIVRIWADTDVIYDARTGVTPISKYPNMGFTYYPGNETDEPDPDIEAIDGVGNVEAFRGTSKMVLVDIPIHQFGYRLPNFTVEFEAEDLPPLERFAFNTSFVPSPAGDGTEFGMLTYFDNPRHHFYSVHHDSNTNTQWVISKYDTETCDVLLETAIPDYLDGVTTAPLDTAYFIYSQVGTWQNMMCVSGDGTKLWLLNCGGGAGTQTYELWQLDTSDFSIINTFPLTIGGSTRQLADGMLCTNGDGSIVAKIGGAEGGGYVGHTPIRAHVLRDDGNYSTFAWTTYHANIQNVYNAVFDNNDYLHVNGSDLLSGTTSYWIKKHQVQSNATLTNIASRVLLSFSIPNNNPGAPVTVSDGLVSLDGQMAYNSVTGAINLLTLKPWSGTSACEMLFIDPSTYADAQSPLTVYANWVGTWGDRRYKGGWVSDNIMIAFATSSIAQFSIDGARIADTSPDTIVLIDLATGAVSYYPLNTLWPAIAGSPLQSMYYNISETSIMAIDATPFIDGEGPGSLLLLPFPGTMNLQILCEEACKQVGLTTADFDFSAFAVVPVIGAICKDRQALRDFLSSLQPAYFFDIIESDWKLKGVLRTGLPISATIDEGDCINSDGSPTQGFSFTDTNPLEVPPWIDVTFMDQTKDYQSGTQPARLPQASYLSATSGTTLQLPIVCNADYGATVGARILDAAWAERDQIDWMLSQKYIALEPTDVINLNRSGEITEVKIVSGDISPAFELNISAMSHDGDVYTQVASASDRGWFVSQTVKVYSVPFFIGMDTPLLRPIDDSPGTYSAVGGMDGLPLESCNIIMDGVDTGVTSSGNPVWGTYDSGTSTFDPVDSWLILDTTSVLTVVQAYGSWASQPIDDVLADASLNLTMFGDEMIQFCTATQVTPGVWELTNLLRGRMGTETLIDSHSFDDFVVAIDPNTMENIPYDGSRINTAAEFIAEDEVHGYDSSPFDTTLVTRRLKSYAPFVANSDAVVRDGSDNLTVTFQYRSRMSARNFWPAPVFGTDTRVFECDILDSPGGTVLRTITGAASANGSVVDYINLTVYYDAADQVIDFGSAQSSISIVLYQLNTILGRGYPGEELV